MLTKLGTYLNFDNELSHDLLTEMNRACISFTKVSNIEGT